MDDLLKSYHIYGHQRLFSDDLVTFSDTIFDLFPIGLQVIQLFPGFLLENGIVFLEPKLTPVKCIQCKVVRLQCKAIQTDIFQEFTRIWSCNENTFDDTRIQ